MEGFKNGNMNHLGLFEGIGGFSLAAHWCGWDTKHWVEINPFCQKVLAYRFPEAVGNSDIFNFNGQQYEGTIDIISGGFPCQSFSLAGKGAMDLSLWKEMLRVICEVKPSFVVAENVYGILARKKGMALEIVCSDLESKGYTVFPPFIIPACSKGAPHRRDRVWIIAYSDRNERERRKFRSNRQEKGKSQIKENKWEWVRHDLSRDAQSRPITNANRAKLQRIEKSGNIIKIWKNGKQLTWGHYKQPDWKEFPTVSPISIRNDGISSGLVRYSDGTNSRFNEAQVKSRLRKESIKASGNAITPQVCYEIFSAINQFVKSQ